jgi:serine/threonine protein kinase
MGPSDAKHQKALQGIHREIVIMKLINHPCIMALYDLQETENEL